ncbi:MAG: methionyl-tRNA formyltransferase, partial [Verrucomicrobiales bacterium]
YDPWPGTSSKWLADGSSLNGKRLKIFPPTTVIPETDVLNLVPGQLAIGEDSNLQVQTGSGLLQLSQLQMEGKRRMDAAAFLKGNSLPKAATVG